MSRADVRCYLAIDLGAESGRAVVGRLERDRLHVRELHRFAHAPIHWPTGLHWDLPGLWNGVLESLRRAADPAARDGAPLASIGVNTWGVDFALLSASGELLGLPHAYRDERNVAAMQHVLDQIGPDALYAQTGNQFKPFNTLFQLAAIQRSDPRLLDQADRLLFMPDLFHYLLTGRCASELTIASTSQMLDVNTGQWATGLLERLKLPTRFLCELVQPGHSMGALLPEVVEATGLPADTCVIVPAAHDTASAVAAIPSQPGTSACYLSCGTWSLLGAETSRPFVTAEAREAPFTHERGVGGVYRFLKIITGLWLLQECRREFAARGQGFDYADVEALAAGAAPFRTLVNPDDPSFATPGHMLEKIAAFAHRTRQPEPTTPGEFVRCCLESLALAYRHGLTQLERVLSCRFDVIHVIGGGVHNKALNRMTADACARPVIAGPAEATAIGNLLIQALGEGRIGGLDELRRIVSASIGSLRFEPINSAAWEAPFERFLNHVESLEHR